MSQPNTIMFSLRPVNRRAQFVWLAVSLGAALSLGGWYLFR